jgi:phospholipid/cholesterol/gamma-HCH transport system substrate-binding protein
MERNAHYAMVGVISLALLVALSVFVVWLAGGSFSHRYDEYDVEFQGPIRGLSSGGEVFFNGIRVGEVLRLRLDAKDPNQVHARIRVTSDSPVRVDSRANLEPLGVTGVNYIQISAGTVSQPLLKDVTPFGQTGVIQSNRSTLDSLLEGGGNVLTRAVEALDRFNRVLSEKNIKELSGALSDIHVTTTAIRNQTQIIGDLDATVKSINQTSERIGALSEDSRKLVNEDARKALISLAAAATELKSAAADTRAAVAKLEAPADDFARTGLPQLTRTTASLQAAAESLDRLVSEVERNPTGTLTKAPAKTVEIKP